MMKPARLPLPDEDHEMWLKALKAASVDLWGSLGSVVHILTPRSGSSPTGIQLCVGHVNTVHTEGIYSPEIPATTCQTTSKLSNTAETHSCCHGAQNRKYRSVSACLILLHQVLKQPRGTVDLQLKHHHQTLPMND